MSSPTVAFFGATGGVAGTILIHTLLAGYKAIALVRKPQKLHDRLKAQEVPENLLGNLTIVEGNALDVAAVKKTLTAGGPQTLPSVIVSGLGGAPAFTFNWRRPFQFASLDNPTICESGAATLTAALQELYTEQSALKVLPQDKKPLLAFVSTTGITRGPEDVPFWIRFLYHQILTIPHVDKKKMENIYRADLEQADASTKLFRSVVGIRPTLLTPYDNSPSDYRDALGVDKVRAGTELNPAIGYSIKRGDVGLWVFEMVIKEALNGQKGKWEGEMISLTS
jgi:hypothetical protein